MSLNLTQYAALLVRIYELEEQLRTNPPDTPAEYVALVSEIQKLWSEANTLLKRGSITEEQIRELRDEAHAANQQRSNDVGPGTFRYSELLTSEPDESQLKSGDEIYGNSPVAASQWIVWGGMGRKPSGAGWHLLKTIA